MGKWAVNPPWLMVDRADSVNKRRLGGEVGSMRGELMKKLLASYGRDEEFRAVAEQIIEEEESKNNKVLARGADRLTPPSRKPPYPA